MLWAKKQTGLSHLAQNMHISVRNLAMAVAGRHVNSRQVRGNSADPIVCCMGQQRCCHAPCTLTATNKLAVGLLTAMLIALLSSQCALLWGEWDIKESCRPYPVSDYTAVQCNMHVCCCLLCVDNTWGCQSCSNAPLWVQPVLKQLRTYDMMNGIGGPVLDRFKTMLQQHAQTQHC
jgi:hypothetical protein